MIAPAKRKRAEAKLAEIRRFIDVEIVNQGVVPVNVRDIKIAPENDQLYRPVLVTDPAIIALGESIRDNGLGEPLVLSLDNYIISGHRRFAGCKLAGMTMIPCRYLNVRRDSEPDRFLMLLREYNRQRVKSLGEQIRESIIDSDPEEALAELVEYRREKSEVSLVSLSMGNVQSRKEISAAKIPFCDSIIRVIRERREYWPLSDRQPADRPRRKRSDLGCGWSVDRVQERVRLR